MCDGADGRSTAALPHALTRLRLLSSARRPRAPYSPLCVPSTRRARRHKEGPPSSSNPNAGLPNIQGVNSLNAVDMSTKGGYLLLATREQIVDGRSTSKAVQSIHERRLCQVSWHPGGPGALALCPALPTHILSNSLPTHTSSSATHHQLLTISYSPHITHTPPPPPPSTPHAQTPRLRNIRPPTLG